MAPETTSRPPAGPWLRIPRSQPLRLSDRISLTPAGALVADRLTLPKEGAA
jgi:hypothetical protein